MCSSPRFLAAGFSLMALLYFLPDPVAGQELNRDYARIVLPDGRIFQNARVSRFDGNQFTIEHATGIIRVPHSKMPEVWRSAFTSQSAGSSADPGDSAPSESELAALDHDTLRAHRSTYLNSQGHFLAFTGKLIADGYFSYGFRGKEKTFDVYRVVQGSYRAYVYVPKATADARAFREAVRSGEEQIIFTGVPEFDLKNTPYVMVIGVGVIAATAPGDEVKKAGLHAMEEWRRVGRTRYAQEEPSGAADDEAKAPLVKRVNLREGRYVYLKDLGGPRLYLSVEDVKLTHLTIRTTPSRATRVPLETGLDEPATLLGTDSSGHEVYYIHTANRPNHHVVLEFRKPQE